MAFSRLPASSIFCSVSWISGTRVSGPLARAMNGCYTKIQHNRKQKVRKKIATLVNQFEPLWRCSAGMCERVYAPGGGGGVALWTDHTCSSSAALGRLVASLTRQLAIKSLNCGDHASGLANLGGGFCGMWKMAC